MLKDRCRRAAKLIVPTELELRISFRMPESTMNNTHQTKTKLASYLVWWAY